MGNSETCSLLDDGAGLLKCVCSLLIAVVGCPVLGVGGGGGSWLSSRTPGDRPSAGPAPPSLTLRHLGTR